MIVATVLWNGPGKYENACFINAEAEAQKAWVTCPKSHSWEIAVLIAEPAMIMG